MKRRKIESSVADVDFFLQMRCRNHPTSLWLADLFRKNRNPLGGA